jgi:hypothetical protein
MRPENFNKNNTKTTPGISIEGMKYVGKGAQTPSFFSCFPCFMNLNDKHVTQTDKDQNLSYNERINYLFTDLTNIDGLNSLSNQYRGNIIENMRSLLFEMAKKIDEYEKKDEIQTEQTAQLQNTAEPMIPIQGYINVTAKKWGFFLFNKNNKNGLRLEKIYFDQAVVVVQKNFTDEDCQTFSHRSLLDNMMEGNHMTSDKIFDK